MLVYSYFVKNPSSVSYDEEEIDKSTMLLLGGGRPARWHVPAVAAFFPDGSHGVLLSLVVITTWH